MGTYEQSEVGDCDDGMGIPSHHPPSHRLKDLVIHVNKGKN
jgi:hypothetical protein